MVYYFDNKDRGGKPGNVDRSTVFVLQAAAAAGSTDVCE